MGMVYTTSFDGLDGLTSGIALSGLTLFALSLNEQWTSPITATLAVIFAGSLGFNHNFHPASIF